MAREPLFAGIDLGTQGIRAVAIDLHGEVQADARVAFAPSRAGDLHEQQGEQWIRALQQCCRKLFSSNAIRSGQICALAVDGTSGTIIPVDAEGKPLAPAIMYNDSRAEQEALWLNHVAGDWLAQRGYRFRSSFGLPKILWLARHRPQVYEKTTCFLHAADVLNGYLTGEWRSTDMANALKTGYDLEAGGWPEPLLQKAGLDVDKFPRVLITGHMLGRVRASAARETGLPAGIPVFAGTTDGNAAFFASGACQPGDWNSTLGTTLVVRGISRHLVRDPLGRIYCHRHPDGFWLPGGASNTGGECLAARFAHRDFATLDSRARDYLPTSLLVYPLMRRGERLPVNAPHIQGFVLGKPRDEWENYAAHLEGVAYVERWIFEVLQELNAGPVNRVFLTGGGARSSVWSSIRACVLGVPLYRPRVWEPAFGSALIAAAGFLQEKLSELAARLVKLEEEFLPYQPLQEAYEARYAAFREAFHRHLLSQ